MLGGVLALAVVMVGCTASGVADFVKFSSDGQRIVYQDSLHPRVYVYYTQTRQKHVFAGRVACLDRDVCRMVLFSVLSADYEDYPDPIPCTLVRIEGDQPQLTRLPSLPRGPVWGPWATHVCVEFTSEPDVLSAKVSNQPKKNEPYQDHYYRLCLGHSEWTQSPPPEQTKLWAYRTAGLREGGHVFASWVRGFGPPMTQPARAGSGTSLPADPTGNAMTARWRAQRRQKDGVDLQDGDPHALYLLPSPDRKFVVRIADLDDRWRRVSIVEVASGRKDILLDKDDFILVIPQTIITLFFVNPVVLISGGI